MQKTVLIVEDERDLVEVLEYNLKKEGYSVRTAMNGTEAMAQIAADPTPDLVLLDLMLPDISGIEICRRIRARERARDTLVIMLTAKGEEIDRIVGFEVGCDDYVTKPFSVRELMLRLQALFRRRGAPTQDEDTITYGILCLDVPGHIVTVNKKEVSLTALEFKLLHTLVTRKGRVQTREMLLSDVWEIHADITTRTVDTHVKRLREKLDEAGVYVETIRGVGYRFRSSPDPEEAE